ncbi:oligosaccharyl transferase subunit ost3/OST6 [Scheffersomyces spartinae]|uniref:Oligosaccharyl transferase subunit ost3/OST6 n=1 Tax=Scheffersomyces spartinae TaxID=45513 RepID=A0A9P7V844_9ASCO|nr:oligosaccharyl transferase subunit ost3/OST6 [Scheffersomyces spartinae]KAG7193165.1 oligosaccharyl transferase subunit ost3/OST6 [Scheffersomyces spartinae]
MFGVQKVIALFLSLAVVIAGVAPATLQNQLTKKTGSKWLQITDNNYRDIMGGARDYHLVLMMTTDLTMINCVLCQEFKPAFSLMADSWFQDHPTGVSGGDNNDIKDVFFGYTDFANSRALFSEFGLQSIPKVFYFPPTNSKLPSNYLKSYTEYPFYQGDHVELLKNWVSENTGQTFNVYVPLNYNLIIFNAVMTFVVLVSVYLFSAKLKKLIASKFLWCALSLIAVLLFTCGSMFNRIRNTPFVKETENGPQYFAPGQQAQYGIETQLISFLYGVLSLCVILLVKKLPQLSDGKVQLLGSAIVCAIVLFAYSMLLNIFSVKSQGYPYRLAI